MGDAQSFANHFLIAMPTLEDPNFSQTVTYICEHNSDGALGIVINRPADLTLADLFDHMAIETNAGVDTMAPVYIGGPVQRERGFVIHSPPGDWDACLAVDERIGVTTSQDVLEAAARGEGPTNYLVALGYAGWSAGQLEEEMANNAWLSGPADPDVIFQHDSGQRWQAAAALLGVDLSLLSSQGGHA
jgi:putative transcriptional regulator